MKLQIAIDVADVERALEITGLVCGIVDIVEVGTPMIIRDGLVPVRAIKNKYPSVSVLADTKIVDGGDLECGYACEAGADIVTVLAVSANQTISAVVETAHRYGKQAMVDLISVTDIAGRAKEIEALGVDYICVHTAVDVQTSGRTPLEDLKVLTSAIPSEKTAVAGGISIKTLADYKALRPAIVIAGGSLMNAPDLRAAASEMKSALLK